MTTKPRCRCAPLAIVGLATACVHAPAVEQGGVGGQQTSIENLENVPSGRMLYFVGQTLKTSPDGRILWGLPRRAAYKRLVVPINRRIIEYFFDEESFHVMMLSQVERSNRFTVTEKDNQFSGHLETKRSPWDWHDWTFELITADGGQRIVGSGTFFNDQMRIERRVLEPDGKEAYRYIDELRTANKDEFEALLKDIAGLPPQGAAGPPPAAEPTDDEAGDGDDDGGGGP